MMSIESLTSHFFLMIRRPPKSTQRRSSRASDVYKRQFPYFAESGEGCRYKDVDGNEYIDYLAGYGPIVLGYNDPVVEAAADAQRKLGAAFNHPTPRAVELAEKLVDLIPAIDWCAFGKNGSDVTAYAIQTAREHTQRRNILMAKGAYHGSHSWCRHGLGGWLSRTIGTV